MNLFDMVNLYNSSVEDRIIRAINMTKEELAGLTTDQTCRLYNDCLFTNLRKNHVVFRIVCTTDIGGKFEHYFTLVPANDNFYLLDLTFKQFLNSEGFEELLNKGYQLIDNNDWLKYMKIVGLDSNYPSLMDTFNVNVVSKKGR